MSMGGKKRTAGCGTASAAAVLFSISIHSPASSKAFGFPEPRTRPSESSIKGSGSPIGNQRGRYARTISAIQAYISLAQAVLSINSPLLIGRLVLRRECEFRSPRFGRSLFGHKFFFKGFTTARNRFNLSPKRPGRRRPARRANFLRQL
jgi:hypothetical protein